MGEVERSRASDGVWAIFDVPFVFSRSLSPLLAASRPNPALLLRAPKAARK